jgi:hypothetical protein
MTHRVSRLRIKGRCKGDTLMKTSISKPHQAVGHRTIVHSAFPAQLIWLPALLCLAACQQSSGDAAFETYLERLGRPLGVIVATPQSTPLPKPPRSGQLQLALPGGKLDTLDFLALSGCKVQVTIGKRNSSLGRMAKPSQRLLLQLEFLRLAPACEDKLRAENRAALADLLAHTWQLKHNQLPALAFNATLGSDEYRAFWRKVRPAGEYPSVADNIAVSALQAINGHMERWLAGDFMADNTEFELLLGEVAGGDGGAVLRSMAHQADWLDAANDMLARRMSKGPLCSRPQPNDAANIIARVVQKYFVAGTQPQAAQLNRRFYALAPPVNALEAKLVAVLPDLYRQWVAARNALLARAQNAPRQHVEQIQALLKGCNSTLGRTVDEA